MGAKKSKPYIRPDELNSMGLIGGDQSSKEGHHETEMCYGSEAELKNLYSGCEKNPGHVNFIPVNNFNLDNIPSLYSDVTMLSLIKVLSGLTVLIKINYTSYKRPKSGGSFRYQYPCYETRGDFVLRTGTGRVWEVVKHKKSTCPCEKCKSSDTPSKVWGEVHVLTATQVVFDDIEARHSTCVVDFDDYKNPGVSLDGWRVIDADMETDRCLFTCVTCDVDLLKTLDKLCRRFNKLCRKVKEEFCGSFLGKLTVIVSHPHGCPKKITVGQWTHVRENDGWTVFTYTTCTCPGSSGACIYMPGYDFRMYSHIHSGSNSKGNFSGKAWLYQL